MRFLPSWEIMWLPGAFLYQLTKTVKYAAVGCRWVYCFY